MRYWSDCWGSVYLVLVRCDVCLRKCYCPASFVHKVPKCVPKCHCYMQTSQHDNKVRLRMYVWPFPQYCFGYGRSKATWGIWPRLASAMVSHITSIPRRVLLLFCKKWPLEECWLMNLKDLLSLWHTLGKMSIKENWTHSDVWSMPLRPGNVKSVTVN